MLDRHKTVREALQYVADRPGWPEEGARLDMEIWEIVARNLYDHALFPDARVVGSVGRSVRAQRIIFNRTTGMRRTGTHPAQASDQKITFKDLGEQGELNGK